MTTAYFNLNTSNLANCKNLKKTQTETNINNSFANKSNLYTNTNNNFIRESGNFPFMENEEKLLLRGKTEEIHRIKKRIQMNTFKRNDLKLNNEITEQNLDFESDKIFIISSNPNKNKKNSIKQLSYNYLGTTDSIASPKHGRIIIPNSAQNNRDKKAERKFDKKFKSEVIISETDKSHIFSQNISKVSREGLLLNSSNNGLFDEKRNHTGSKNIYSLEDKNIIEMADFGSSNNIISNLGNVNNDFYDGNINDLNINNGIENNELEMLGANINKNSHTCDKLDNLNNIQKEFFNYNENNHNLINDNINFKDKDNNQKNKLFKGNSIGGNAKNNLEYFSIASTMNRDKNNQNHIKAELGEDFILDVKNEDHLKEQILDISNLEENENPKINGNHISNNEILKDFYKSLSLRDNINKPKNKSSFSVNYKNQQVYNLINEDVNKNEIIIANKIKSKTMDLLENIFGSNENNHNSIKNSNNNNANYKSNSKEKEKINFVLKSAQTKNNKKPNENSSEILRYSITEIDNLDNNNNINFDFYKNIEKNNDKIYIKSLDFENIENANEIFDVIKKENHISQNKIPSDVLTQETNKPANSLENNFVVKNDFKQNQNYEANYAKINDNNALDLTNDLKNKINLEGENIIGEFDEKYRHKTIDIPNETNNDIMFTAENDDNKSCFGKNSTKAFINIPSNIRKSSRDFEYNKQIQNIKTFDNANTNFKDINGINLMNNYNEIDKSDKKINNISALNNKEINSNFDDTNFIFEENEISQKNYPISQNELLLNKPHLISCENLMEKSRINSESPKFNSNKLILNVKNDEINCIDKNNKTSSRKVSADISKLNPKKYDKLQTEDNKNEGCTYESDKKAELDLVTIETDYNRDERNNQINLGTESARNSNLFTEKNFNIQLNNDNTSQVLKENQEDEFIPTHENDSELQQPNNNAITNHNNQNKNNQESIKSDNEANTQYFNTNDINNFNFDTNLNTNIEVVSNKNLVDNQNSNFENNLIYYEKIADSNDKKENKQVSNIEGNHKTNETYLVINKPIIERTNNNNNNNNSDEYLNSIIKEDINKDKKLKIEFENGKIIEE